MFLDAAVFSLYIGICCAPLEQTSQSRSSKDTQQHHASTSLSLSPLSQGHTHKKNRVERCLCSEPSVLFLLQFQIILVSLLIPSFSLFLFLSSASSLLFLSFRSSKAHPGPVVHISDNPMDEGKVCIQHSVNTVLSSVSSVIHLT